MTSSGHPEHVLRLTTPAITVQTRLANTFSTASLQVALLSPLLFNYFLFIYFDTKQGRHFQVKRNTTQHRGRIFILVAHCNLYEINY